MSHPSLVLPPPIFRLKHGNCWLVGEQQLRVWCLRGLRMFDLSHEAAAEQPPSGQQPPTPFLAAAALPAATHVTHHPPTLYVDLAHFYQANSNPSIEMRMSLCVSLRELHVKSRQRPIQFKPRHRKGFGFEIGASSKVSHTVPDMDR